MWVTDRSFPFRLLKGDESANQYIVLPNQSIYRNPEPHSKTNSHQHCFGTFSEAFETPSENPKLSWKGLKVFGIFKKSSDINLLPNRKKKRIILQICHLVSRCKCAVNVTSIVQLAKTIMKSNIFRHKDYTVS